MTSSPGLPPAMRAALSRASAATAPRQEGRIIKVQGIALHAVGLSAAVGDLCEVQPASAPGMAPLRCEVAGFTEQAAILMPLGDPAGVAPFDPVVSMARPLQVVTGPGMLGRIVDALGQPIDGGPPLEGPLAKVLDNAPAPLTRRPITEAMPTGVAAIDGFLTCGRGQRIGIFAGSGVGKSTVLGTIAKEGGADINVVALIGERGREVGEFLTDVLGPEGLARSVVVVATADQAPMVRLKGAFTAVTIAESFRNLGADVLFVMDSVTRFAQASREVGLAAGEPPTLRGYPPSLFAQMPRLVERLGSSDRGSITGLLTVLVDGDDFNEPVSDALRGYLDGHIVLDRSIAARGQFPAIDVLASISRLMDKVASDDHNMAARKVRGWLARYEESRDLIAVGAYRRGSDPDLDEAITRIQAIETLLYQGRDRRGFDSTLAGLAEIIQGPPGQTPDEMVGFPGQ